MISSDSNNNDNASNDNTSKEIGIVSDIQESSGQKNEDIQNAVTVERTEIYNENNITITLSNLTEESDKFVFDFVLNSTSDKDYSISPHSYSVNKIMAATNDYGGRSVDLPAGKNSKLQVPITKDWLRENGIEELCELEIIFWAYYNGIQNFSTELISIKTNIFDDSKRFDYGVQMIYSDDNIDVYLKDKGENVYKFIIFNKEAKLVSYTFDNCSINDWAYRITDYTYDLYDEEVHAQSYSVCTLIVDEDFLKENSMTNIENLEFNIEISDDDLEKHVTEKIVIK